MLSPNVCYIAYIRRKQEVVIMYMAIDLAKYIVSKCTRERTPISNLQLQKILYYIQKEWLISFEKPFFIDDIEAWQFGPVVPNVYFHFSGFGAMPIVMEYDHIGFEEKENLIDTIVDSKKLLYPWDLVAETHKQEEHGKKSIKMAMEIERLFLLN